MAEAGFTALLLDDNDGTVTPTIQRLDDDRLPDGDVTVAVAYSSLNYKDGMVVKGQGRLVRDYPHVPGIDFAGTVIDSASPEFKPGDEVILTGWRVGEAHWGGMATRARVKSDWLVKMPEGMTLLEAMAIGTAGFTAMLAVMALEDHGVTPDSEGEVLVTGAAGGVGSIATAVLSQLGYAVAAQTGRAEAHDYLTSLGAAAIVGRDELAEKPRGPLATERWAGAVDSLGGDYLANVLAAMRYRASVAAVGLAAGPQVQMTVIPFLLRGINLLGIDSVMCPMAQRQAAWWRLAADLPRDKLAAITNTAPLSQVPDLAEVILAGGVRGRTVIDVNG